MKVDVGDPAPPFSVAADDGRNVSLEALRGKRVVLYFYPRADTAGCTTEACAIRDEYAGFQEKDVVVLGSSPDTVEAQRKFKEKYHLPFTLLADHDHRIADDYGAWVLRTRPNGEQSMGVQRSTFIIGPDGRVQRVFPQVTPADHAKELLAAL
jgi:peroxiredoxin Q/BCP